MLQSNELLELLVQAYRYPGVYLPHFVGFFIIPKLLSHHLIYIPSAWQRAGVRGCLDLLLEKMV